MVDGRKVYQIIFSDCIDYVRNKEYQLILESCGCRIQDYVINFNNNRVKYYIVTNASIDDLMYRISLTPYGDKIIDRWKKTKGVNEL